MTGKTTRIWIELTDEQMDKVETWEGIRMWEGSIWRLVCDAIKAQRPRPIAVGDRVQWNNNVTCDVRAVHSDKAWLWQGATYFGTYPVTSLSRVDDEAAK